jgi:hypothetical protein
MFQRRPKFIVCACPLKYRHTVVNTASGKTAPDPVSVLGLTRPLYRVSNHPHITRSTRVAIVQRSQDEEMSGLDKGCESCYRRYIAMNCLCKVDTERMQAEGCVASGRLLSEGSGGGKGSCESGR